MNLQELKNKVNMKVAAVLLAVVAALLGNVSPVKLGGEEAGLQASVASSSIIAVGPDLPTVVFTETGNCQSRSITTAAQAIRISFGSKTSASVSDATTTVSSTRGLYQAANNTTLYSAQDFGCGYVGVTGLVATTTLTITESR